MRNGAGAWRKGECWDEPKKPYAGRGRDEPRPRGLGASAEGVRRNGDEDCALRASRKREDAEQALGYMNRRALERGRRSGLKEQEESWCGAVRLFDGAQARERYSLLAKDPLRGHKSPICEECRKTNFLLENLAWEMPAEARVNGFLRTRGLTYRRLLSTALCFSRRRVVEGQGGGKTAFRMLTSQPVSRGRVTTSAIPLMCRGMTNHRHAVSAMPLTHHKPECHAPCFLRLESSL